MPALMTQSEYARHRGCTDAAVLKAIRSERITTVQKDGKTLIDPDVADIQWARNTRPRSAPPSVRVLEAPSAPAAALSSDDRTPIEAELYDIQAARAKREHHEANIAAMKEARQAGDLVEAKAVARATTEIGSAFAEAAQQLIQLAKELAAESDPVKVRTLLEERINAALTDAADRLGELAAGRGAR
jgi:hypothetical protein